MRSRFLRWCSGVIPVAAEIENGRAFGAQRRALEMRGQVAVAPVRRAALRIADLGQHDEAGQILVHRTEPVVHPRTDAGSPPKRLPQFI
jgi:hypothetical protein